MSRDQTLGILRQDVGIQDAVRRLNVQLVGHVEDVQHDGHVHARGLDPHVNEAERRRVTIDGSTCADQRHKNRGLAQPSHGKGNGNRRVTWEQVGARPEPPATPGDRAP